MLFYVYRLNEIFGENLPVNCNFFTRIKADSIH